jgi:tripartite-type tricarboxylate transporter receptor subunit TctC
MQMTPLSGMASCLQKPIIILLLLTSPASIQGAMGQHYPTRPITVIVPLTAGGGTDTTARILADRMKTALGQPIVVENVPAAAVTVGVGRLAQAVPDGHTIGIGDQTSFVISSVTNAVRYDVLKDFDPISLLSTSPVALIARKTMQAPDLKQLIVWLRANPERTTAGSFGQGSGPHVVSVAFQNLTGTQLRMVPYRGVAPAVQDLIGGQLDLLFVEQSTMIGPLRSGMIKAYAILAKDRSAAVPEVPTVEEAGGPSLHITTWRGMWVPKGTPTDISSRLNSAVVAALSDASVQERIAAVGQEVVPRSLQTPQALAVHHKAEIEKWTPMIRAAEITIR